jgi:hypothetical protein
MQRLPFQRIDPDGGVSRSWKNRCKNKWLSVTRMNEVSASEHWRRLPLDIGRGTATRQRSMPNRPNSVVVFCVMVSG